jgi:heptosyltransferase-3
MKGSRVSVTDHSAIRRLLIYRLGSLGDTLLALPALHLIRQSFPEAEVTLLTHVPTGSKAAAMVSILEHTNLHQHVIRYPLRLRSFGQIKVLRDEIAARRFQLAIHLAEYRGPAKTLRDYIFFRACGIRRVLGLPWRREQFRGDSGRIPVLSRLANLSDGARTFLSALGVRTSKRTGMSALRQSWDAPGDGTEQVEWEAGRLVRRLACLGKPNLDEEKWWDLRLSDEEEAEADKFLSPVRGPFLAASLGTKVEVNHWTESNWRPLIRQIHQRRPDLNLVFVGAGDEFASCERCSQDWAALKLNLCGKITPRVSAAILRRARVFVGHDSGPLHLAATVGTPCVGIYSARHRPGQWFPRGNDNVILYHRTPCYDCGLNVCVEHRKKCILSITVEEAVAAVDKQLGDECGALALTPMPFGYSAEALSRRDIRK